MPDFFHLDFDSTAPEITWGTISGVGRNRILIARYTVDEPGVVAAQFIDAANVATDLVVHPDRLVGRIPATATYGQGVIRAWLQDDVGNTSVRSEYVTLSAPTFHIELDTTPPVVTWGPVDGTEQGDTFTVQYALDEPDLLSAELELADHRVLPMQVFPDTLMVSLPMDAPDGPATVRAFVQDDVGNAATRTLVVIISGTPITPPTPTFGAGGLPHVERHRLVTSSRTSARTRSSASSEGRLRGETHGRTRDRWVRQEDAIRVITRGRARASTGLRTRPVQMRDKVLVSAHFDLSKRSEGPDAEAQLLLVLDLL